MGGSTRSMTNKFNPDPITIPDIIKKEFFLIHYNYQVNNYNIRITEVVMNIYV